ncbi:hypothetical protein CK203_101275 [Vitis vinifera]|uniref:Glycosyl transferase CAP10 domain-containing protein n=1 Tax=Vitis vinifera TaxID=29760 RepID=A0A438D5G9_VITVI|nr:hypothetical protein CK203_101275 [Vitis vinifera]
MAQACPANHPTTSVTGKLSVEACPEYFRWIHEDLRPWKSTGISRFAVESAEGDADFRLVIVNGKAYVEHYTLTGDQNWEKEPNGGFKNSNLAYKCTHRYKIYVEGWGWSVSEKYVLACDSMTLLIKPYPHDFFTRSMVPLLHYWPIRPRNKCRDLKFAVEWGNTHPEKLLKFKPAVPPGAVELCLETMDCSADAPIRWSCNWPELLSTALHNHPPPQIVACTCHTLAPAIILQPTIGLARQAAGESPNKPTPPPQGASCDRCPWLGLVACFPASQQRTMALRPWLILLGAQGIAPLCCHTKPRAVAAAGCTTHMSWSPCVRAQVALCVFGTLRPCHGVPSSTPPKSGAHAMSIWCASGACLARSRVHVWPTRGAHLAHPCACAMRVWFARGALSWVQGLPMMPIPPWLSQGSKGLTVAIKGSEL